MLLPNILQFQFLRCTMMKKDDFVGMKLMDNNIRIHFVDWHGIAHQSNRCIWELDNRERKSRIIINNCSNQFSLENGYWLL